MPTLTVVDAWWSMVAVAGVVPRATRPVPFWETSVIVMVAGSGPAVIWTWYVGRDADALDLVVSVVRAAHGECALGREPHEGGLAGHAED